MSSAPPFHVFPATEGAEGAEGKRPTKPLLNAAVFHPGVLRPLPFTTPLLHSYLLRNLASQFPGKAITIADKLAWSSQVLEVRKALTRKPGPSLYSCLSLEEWVEPGRVGKG